MCGRARQVAAPNALRAAAMRDAAVPHNATWKNADSYSPTENLCPGKMAAVVVCAEQGTPAHLETKTWGLVASYDKADRPDFWRMFNARSETLHTSPVFKRLVRAKRCAVPLDGFWEWKEDELVKKDGKQPWYVHRKSGEPLWMAGLCDTQLSSGLETFTLITMDVDAKLRCVRVVSDSLSGADVLVRRVVPCSWLHDRQPVILDRAGLAAWLAPPPPPASADEGPSSAASLPGEAEAALRATLPVAELGWHPTTKKVSKMDYQGSDAATPVKLPSQQQRSVASFFKRSPSATLSASSSPSDVLPRSAAPASSSAEADDATPEAKVRVLADEPHAKRPKTASSTASPAASAASAAAPCGAAEDALPWACAVCTFEHVLPSNMGFLSCEICQTPRA